MKRLTIALMLLAFAGLVYILWSSSYSQTTAQPIDTDQEPEPSPVSIAPDTNPPPIREVVETPAPPDKAQKLPWDPSVLQIDPHWCMPTDLKQNMHWIINGSALMSGELVPPSYSCQVSDVALDVQVNPNGVVLTDAEAEQLNELLAADHEVLQEMGKEEWRLKGVAFHEAIERGDFVSSGEVNLSSRTGLFNEEGGKRLQPIMDQETLLRERFGKPFRDFCITVCNGPPPNLSRRYIVFVPRARAPKAFQVYDEAIRVKQHAKQKARDFIANLPR